MLIARPLSAISGLLILVLLSRTLSSDDYGIYFAVWALAEILILASNLGLIHAAYRYIHADEYIDGKLVPHGPVWRLIAVRLFSLIILAAGLYSFSPSFIADAESQLAYSVASIVAAIVVFEGLARFVEIVMDSMLCQGRSQTSLVSRTVFRLMGISYFLWVGELNLQNVLLAEMVAIALGFLLGIVLLLDIYRVARASEVVSDTRQDFPLKRMFKYAFPAFLAQLIGLVYGPDVLKLILNKVAGPEALAMFGFAYSLAAVIQRYIPANLMAGIFRPVFVAASKREDAENVLPGLLSLTIKLNWIIIIPIFCASWFGAEKIFFIISHGNYAAASVIFCVLVLGLLPVSVHLILSMYCLARESSWPTVVATASSVLILPLAILLTQYFQATGVAVAFVLSEMLWVMVCYWYIRRKQAVPLSMDWRGMGKLILCACLAVFICELLALLGLSWIILTALVVLVYGLLLIYFRPLTGQEGVWLNAVVPEKLRRMVKGRAG